MLRREFLDRCVAGSVGMIVAPSGLAPHVRRDRSDQPSIRVADHGGRPGAPAAANSAAFAAAFAAAAAEPNGAIVEFDAGVYDQAANWIAAVSGSAPKTITIRGVPGATVLRPAAGVTAAVTLATDVNSDGTDSGLILDGLRIDGSATKGAIGLLVADNAKNLSGRIRVRDCEVLRFRGAGGRGVYLKNGVRCDFDNLYVGLCDTNAYVAGSVPTLPTTGTFSRCQFREATGAGVRFDRGFRIGFESCVFESNGAEGFRAAPAGHETINGLSFSNCWFENNWYRSSAAASSYHLYVDGTGAAAVHFVIRDSRFEVSTSRGIFVEAASNVVIDDLDLSSKSPDRVVIGPHVKGHFLNWPEDTAPYATVVTNGSPQTMILSK